MSRGAVLVTLGLALTVLAGAFGAWSLLVPGVGLILIWLAAQLSVRLTAAGASISREPTEAVLEEGEPLRLKITAQRRLRLCSGEVERWEGAQPLPTTALGGEPLVYTARLGRRGEQLLGPSLLRFSDPFGICERTLSSEPAQVLVLPRVQRLERNTLGRVLAGARDGRRPVAASADTLRPYVPGAPASRIHWPTVARTGVLMERQLRTELDRLPLVVLDARLPASVDALDMAVRAAASLAVALARMGGCRLLLPGSLNGHALEPDMSAWPELHRRLALVRAGGQVSRSALDRSALIVWVSAERAALAPAAVSARSACFTVCPEPRPGVPVALTIAGCALQAPAGGMRQAGAA
jgi:uncharacterized protein (DUF58 family)